MNRMLDVSLEGRIAQNCSNREFSYFEAIKGLHRGKNVREIHLAIIIHCLIGIVNAGNSTND